MMLPQLVHQVLVCVGKRGWREGVNPDVSIGVMCTLVLFHPSFLKYEKMILQIFAFMDLLIIPMDTIISVSFFHTLKMMGEIIQVYTLTQ